jgi:hypothetical protein
VKEGRNVGPAAAEVSRGRPDSLGGERVELAGDQARHEASERRPHLVGPGWEVTPYQHQDVSRAARQFLRKHDVVDVAEEAAVLPGGDRNALRVRLLWRLACLALRIRP